MGRVGNWRAQDPVEIGKLKIGNITQESTFGSDDDDRKFFVKLQVVIGQNLRQATEVAAE